ncbi:MAG TPA: tetratricopeptide repeat protein [Chthoniobacteraceae bacterium]|jgi:tetratricopeptide (TPR) repeat protein|nr:tetratricopeptide repeat protein [Chthoniobacteraceae bacterium]
MHDARYRQLSLAAGWLFLITFIPSPAVGSEANDELRALQARAKTLEAGKPAPGDWKKLETAYSRLVKAYPRDVAIRDAHGDFLLGRDDREGALREWLAAEKLDPKNVAVLNHLAEIYLTTGDVRQAFDHYLRASDLEPADPIAHFNVANVACVFRHEIGKTETEALELALRHFAVAHRLAPQNAELARAYAETFYVVPSPDWKSALKAWQAHLGLVTEKNFTLLNLARVHMKLGQADEARACLQQVQGPENQRLKARLAARIDSELTPHGGPENSQKPVIDGPRPLP